MLLDTALVATGFVTGAMSLTVGFIRTEMIDENLFIKPALRPFGRARQEIHDQGHGPCFECPREFVDPYVRITINRLQLYASLWPVFLGLVGQSILLFVSGESTAGVSWLVWAMIPGGLCAYYILAMKDVFDYWNNMWVRQAIGVVAIGTGVIASANPFLLDFFGWIASPSESIKISSYSLSVPVVVLICIACSVIFYGLRGIFNKHAPTLRTRIVRDLNKSNKSRTIKEWHTFLDPNREIWTEEEVTKCLKELVYQDVMKVEPIDPNLEPLYGKAP